MQIEIDFTGKLPLSAQEGMARCDANADCRWKVFFSACVLMAAKKHAELTVDEVLAEMEALPDAPTTHNKSAAGPRMRQAWRDGIIAPTDRYRRSTRDVSHGNLLAVWRSKFYTERRGE